MSSTIQIDRLLETVVKKKASDLHLAVGKPPVLRMHGDREPHTKPLSTTGGDRCTSGAPNELWSFGEGREAIENSMR